MILNRFTWNKENIYLIYTVLPAAKRFPSKGKEPLCAHDFYLEVKYREKVVSTSKGSIWNVTQAVTIGIVYW